MSSPQDYIEFLDQAPPSIAEVQYQGDMALEISVGEEVTVIEVTQPENLELVDLGPEVGGGGDGTTTWSNLPGKPDTFPPSPHDHAASSIDGLVEAVQDAVAGFLAEGENVTIVRDIINGTLTISSTGGGSGNPANVTIDPALEGLQIIYGPTGILPDPELYPNTLYIALPTGG